MNWMSWSCFSFISFNMFKSLQPCLVALWGCIYGRHGGAFRWKVRGSPILLQLILWINVPDFTAMYPIFVKLLQSGPKWWPIDQPIAMPRSTLAVWRLFWMNSHSLYFTTSASMFFFLHCQIFVTQQHTCTLTVVLPSSQVHFLA